MIVTVVESKFFSGGKNYEKCFGSNFVILGSKKMIFGFEEKNVFLLRELINYC